MKKYISLSGILFFVATVLLPGLASVQKVNADSVWVMNNYYKIERSIPMRDGVKLFTSMYVPKDTIHKHPILMTRTPYSCAPYGESNFRKFWMMSYLVYLKEGYIKTSFNDSILNIIKRDGANYPELAGTWLLVRGAGGVDG